jgi:hypothetical protein
MKRIAGMWKLCPINFNVEWSNLTGLLFWLKALTSSSFRTVLLVGESVTKKTLIGCISGAGMHKSRATKFWTVLLIFLSPLVPRTLKCLLGSWKIWFESRQAVNLLDGGVFDSIANTSDEVNRVCYLAVAWSVPYYCKILGNFSKVKQSVCYIWIVH